VSYESWVERGTLMALDADPEVVAVSSQPMWLHWVGGSGQAKRAGAARVGDPVAVLPTLFAMLWAGELATHLGAARLCSTSRVWATGKRVG